MTIKKDFEKMPRAKKEDQPMTLQDSVAIVTGSSRGIGKAIAIALAREGARVVVAARTRLELQSIAGTIEATAEAIRKQGGRALAITTDVSKEQSVALAVEKTLQEWGRIDILVNNAATNFPAPFHVHTGRTARNDSTAPGAYNQYFLRGDTAGASRALYRHCLRCEQSRYEPPYPGTGRGAETVWHRRECPHAR
jgi:hypothetical protein